MVCIPVCEPLPRPGLPGEGGWRELALSRDLPDLSRQHSREGCARPLRPASVSS